MQVMRSRRERTDEEPDVAPEHWIILPELQLLSQSRLLLGRVGEASPGRRDEADGYHALLLLGLSHRAQVERPRMRVRNRKRKGGYQGGKGT